VIVRGGGELGVVAVVLVGVGDREVLEGMVTPDTRRATRACALEFAQYWSSRSSGIGA
jgi:hypothetical protein